MPRNKTYDVYVVLAHVQRDKHLVPTTAVFNREEFTDWHDLVTAGTLVVWLVERTNVTHARDLVLAHLSGNAPVGVTKLYDRRDTPTTV